MADLETLLAKSEIENVLKRYCRSMDRIDAELGYTVWHEGGLADYGPIYEGTGRGFVDWVCDYHRTLDSTSHQIANILIDVRGKRATSETYVTVSLLGTQDGSRTLIVGRGRYLDEWSHRDGRWAIERRRYVTDFATVQTGAEVMPGWGQRDLDDPSYGLLGPIGGA